MTPPQIHKSCIALKKEDTMSQFSLGALSRTACLEKVGQGGGNRSHLGESTPSPPPPRTDGRWKTARWSESNRGSSSSVEGLSLNDMPVSRLIFSLETFGRFISFTQNTFQQAVLNFDTFFCFDFFGTFCFVFFQRRAANTCLISPQADLRNKTIITRRRTDRSPFWQLSPPHTRWFNQLRTAALFLGYSGSPSGRR